MTSFPATSLVAELMATVAKAETAFRSRWRLATLARLDPELHNLLCEQIELYDRAMVTGTDQDARDQADAMVRGWRAAVSALESPLRPDDAYLTGWDPATNLFVVIAECSGSGARAQIVSKDGERRKVIVVTPDEVAKIVAGVQLIAEAKSLFPDAEVVRFVGAASPEETAAGDEALRAAEAKELEKPPGLVDRMRAVSQAATQ